MHKIRTLSNGKMHTMEKKISAQKLQKAYFLDYRPTDEPWVEEDQGTAIREEGLPNEFYSLLGKVLTFIQRADEES